MGLVGGGEGAFIGPVHRMAAELDGTIELVCGAFSSDPDRSKRSGADLYGLPTSRCYGIASQVAVGEENGLKLRVYGERGGLEWSQMEPNSLIVHWPDRPAELRRTGGAGVSAAAIAATRLPAGHPEGFLEAFATLYRNFAATLRAHLDGRRPDEAATDFPTLADGIRRMAFVETVVESARRGGWVDFPDVAASAPHPSQPVPQSVPQSEQGAA